MLVLGISGRAPLVLFIIFCRLKNKLEDSFTSLRITSSSKRMEFVRSRWTKLRQGACLLGTSERMQIYVTYHTVIQFKTFSYLFVVYININILHKLHATSVHYTYIGSYMYDTIDTACTGMYAYYSRYIHNYSTVCTVYGMYSVYSIIVCTGIHIIHSMYVCMYIVTFNTTKFINLVYT